MGPVSQVILSTGDLQARIGQWIQLTSFQETARLQDSGTASHARPSLSNAYIAPRNEVEQTVAGVWQALFGIEQVGVEDNFFELGGHSLLAVQLLSRLREAFHIKLPVSTLFDAPTVAELAQHIEKAHQLANGEAERVAKLLQLVEQLDDDEVKKLLAEQPDLTEEAHHE
jgi:acyl carrier protein